MIRSKKNKWCIHPIGEYALIYVLARKNYCIIGTKSYPYQNNPPQSRPVCSGYVVNFFPKYHLENVRKSTI